MRSSFFYAARFGRQLAVGSQLVVGKQSETKWVLTQLATLGVLTFFGTKGLDFFSPESTKNTATTGLSPRKGSYE